MSARHSRDAPSCALSRCSRCRRARAGTAQPLLQLAQHRLVPGHGDRLREGDGHEGRGDPEGDRRDARADQGRARQPQGRRLVGRRRRQLPAGGGGRPARGVPLAQRRRSSTTGRSGSPTSRRTASSGVYGGIIALGYNTEIMAKKKLPVPECWKDLPNPALQGRGHARQPELVGHRVPDARVARAGVRARTRRFRYMVEVNKNVTSTRAPASAR